MGSSPGDAESAWKLKADSLAKKNEESAREAAVAQQELSSMKIRNDELMQENELAQQSGEADGLRHELAEKEQQIQTHTANLLQWEQYGQTSQAQTQQNEAQIATLTGEITKLNEQLAEAKTRSGSHDDAMQALQAEAADAKADAAKQKMEATKACNAVTSYEIKIGSLQRELKRLQAVSSDSDGMKIAKLELERDQISLRQKKAETRIEFLELDAKTIKTVRDKLVCEKAAVDDKLAQKEQDVHDLEVKLEQQQREFNEYKLSLEDPDGHGNGDDEGTQNDDDDDDDKENDENATRLKQLRRLLDRERTEKLKADANLHKAETVWKTQERDLQTATDESNRQLTELRQKISELKLRLDLQKEREGDERDRTESRIRTLEVTLSKASDSESAAKSQILVLEEQIAEFELALRADDREASLTNQIRDNRELESRLLDVQKELKDKALTLKKSEIELHYYKNEIERLRNIAREEHKKANPNRVLTSAAQAGSRVDMRQPQTPRANPYRTPSRHTTPAQNSKTMTPNGRNPLPPHQPPPPRQPPPPGGIRTPTANRTPPPPSFPRRQHGGTPNRAPQGTPRARQGYP